MGKTARQSHIWDRDEHDYYIEPEWCSQRLLAEESFEGPIWDPACGSGRIVASALEAGFEAYGSDIVKRSDLCNYHVSFQNVQTAYGQNIICNPPFGIAEMFLELALMWAEKKVAFLLPLTWLTGKARSKLLSETPLYRVDVLSPRPSMPPGAVIEAGEKPGGGTKDFAWFVWLKGFDGEPTVRFLRRDG